MQNPANLQRVSAVITPPVAHVKTNAAMIAAPAGNERLRIWGVICAVANTVTVPARWWADIQTDALARRWIQSSQGFQQNEVYPPGGVTFLPGTGLTLGITCDIANVNFHALVLYTIEGVV